MALLKLLPRQNKSLRHSLILILLISCFPHQAHAQNPNACNPSPAVKAALDALPQQNVGETNWDYHERDLAALHDLLRQFPDDVFVQERYINSMYNRTDKPKVIEEYKAKLAANPQSVQVNYLYAETLEGRDSLQAAQLLENALKLDPNFPWPHYSLAGIYISPMFKEKAKGITHLKAFLDVCPGVFMAYYNFASIDDKELIHARAAQLRGILEKRDDPDAIGAYPELWSLEFKAVPPSGFDALRKQTAADAVRIRALNLTTKREWYDALENAYKLTNDKKNQDWVNDERDLHIPNPRQSPAAAKWFREHEYPGGDATPDAKRAYFTDELKQSEQWIKDRPTVAMLWIDRLRSLIYLDGDAADIEAAAEKAIALEEKDAGPPGPQTYEYFFVGGALAEKHLEPEFVIEIEQKGLAQLALERSEPQFDLYFSKDFADLLYFYNAMQRVESLGYIVSAYVQIKQADKAAVALLQMDEGLQDEKALASDKSDRKKPYLLGMSSYWACAARLAELQARKLDAMAFYENALLARLDAQEKPPSDKQDELADDAKTLWASLGGTDEGWMTWYGRRAQQLSVTSILSWEETSVPLPKFELTDLNGKTWTQDSLKGKVSLLNFWATG